MLVTSWEVSNISKFKYQSLKDHVYNYIAERIQNGTLLPNQKISENSICESLNVSRTPVREALIQMASENYLENIPRKGFIVKELDTKKKLDVFQVVGTLDGMAASLAVDHMTEEDITRLEQLVGQIDLAISAHSYADYQTYQNQFHQTYICKCGNDTLVELLKSLQNSFVRQIYLSEDKQKLFSVLDQMNREHKQIIELFKARDKTGLDHILKHVHWRIDYVDMI
ncbi:GntR family transcriptional regulator [Paenibacillus sp. y28]|uniref:GntR family transcriptional regulator n=1 Tax=Paenibacillus sp. y28 TaxID=3129110 RepID=UPI00301AA48F